MKKIRKLLALSLAAVMCLVLFAGCTPTKGGSSSSESKEDSKGESSNTNETVKVKWIQPGDAPTRNLEGAMKAINDYTKEKINVEFEFEFLGWDNFGQKTNNILNTGENFDIMFTDGDKFIQHASQNKFLALDDYLAGDASGLKSFIPDILWKAVKIRDKVYGVPTYKDSAATQYLAFDKSLVDKYNVKIEDVKSFADLEPVLKKFKEGEGAALFPFPLAKEGYDGWKTNYDNFVVWNDTNAKVVNIYEDKYFVDTMTMLHDWVDKGYINPDASTLGQPPEYRATFSSQAFAGVDAIWTADRGYNIVATPYTETIYSNTTILGSVNAISANTPNKDACVKLLQLVNTDPKLRNMIAFGLEGDHWDDNGDGTVTRKDDTWKAPTYSQGTFFQLKPVTPNSADQWNKVKEQVDGGKSSVLLGFTFDDKNVQDIYMNVNAIFEEHKAELTTGVYKGTTADYLAAFNKKLRDAGLDELLVEIQKQVDEFLGK